MNFEEHQAHAEVMSTTLKDDIKYFQCSCRTLEHMIVVDRFVEKGMVPEFIISVHLSKFHGFFKRLWFGLKYVFNISQKYGHFDCTIIQHEPTVRELVEFLEPGYRKSIDLLLKHGTAPDQADDDAHIKYLEAQIAANKVCGYNTEYLVERVNQIRFLRRYGRKIKIVSNQNQIPSTLTADKIYHVIRWLPIRVGDGLPLDGVPYPVILCDSGYEYTVRNTVWERVFDD